MKCLFFFKKSINSDEKFVKSRLCINAMKTNVGGREADCWINKWEKKMKKMKINFLRKAKLTRQKREKGIKWKKKFVVFYI